ncbi:MAG: ABC transporter substrate-binding protein [Burkholderiaceae bacterium]
MKRRQLVQAFFAAGAWPTQLSAQPAGRIYRVGFLANARRPAQGRHPLVGVMVVALAELGYVEGRNLQLEFRFADGQTERLPEFADELVRLNVDVIVASTNLAGFPAKRASSTIPIVVVASHGAEETGLVASYARPGGNVTGIESLAPELDVKRLELVRATLPKARRVAVLSNPLDQGTALHQRWSRGAADSLQLTLEYVSVSRFDELDAALASVQALQPHALLLFSDSVIVNSLPLIAAHALKQRLPAFAEFRQFADAGGLMAYGASLARLFRDSARYIDRIFKGAKPADLPVERASEYELVINLKTANALGVTVARTLLLRADEVIE